MALPFYREAVDNTETVWNNILNNSRSQVHTLNDFLVNIAPVNGSLTNVDVESNCLTEVGCEGDCSWGSYFGCVDRVSRTINQARFWAVDSSSWRKSIVGLAFKGNFLSLKKLEGVCRRRFEVFFLRWWNDNISATDAMLVGFAKKCFQFLNGSNHREIVDHFLAWLCLSLWLRYMCSWNIKHRACSSRCGGLSQVSSYISRMGWMGAWDQIWTDSGSQRRLHKLTFDLTQ